MNEEKAVVFEANDFAYKALKNTFNDDKIDFSKASHFIHNS
jgi:hypothetical protein